MSLNDMIGNELLKQQEIDINYNEFIEDFNAAIEGKKKIEKK